MYCAFDTESSQRCDVRFRVVPHHVSPIERVVLHDQLRMLDSSELFRVEHDRVRWHLITSLCRGFRNRTVVDTESDEAPHGRRIRTEPSKLVAELFQRLS